MTVERGGTVIGVRYPVPRNVNRTVGSFERIGHAPHLYSTQVGRVAERDGVLAPGESERDCS